MARRGSPGNGPSCLSRWADINRAGCWRCGSPQPTLLLPSHVVGQGLGRPLQQLVASIAHFLAHDRVREDMSVAQLNDEQNPKNSVESAAIGPQFAAATVLGPELTWRICGEVD